MPAFRYKHGDRPLDGYTIQRGVGRGGFGEVYYALSDSGREVALKVIQGYEQIELRGVSQCMNLKSPHLVTIFDVRHNPDGVPFVIMEYVNGPSLRELIDQQPAGLGIQKAAFFLRELGKGLTFLHDCGIVHRDLKPGNVFYENGCVKIGDYGLSKAMSASQHSGQTMTVGTVHYMAPEIGLGKYDRSIDIYAMGAVLFELITGQVPYLGASPGEILMKHMSSEPNVQGIEEPFATVIKRAMAKDPVQRYQTVQEMVEAVFGAEHVRDSVSGFSPGDLSMVAGRVAQRIAVGVGGSSGPPMPPAPPEQPDSWQQAAFADRPNRMTGLATPPPLPIPELPSPVPPARPAAAVATSPVIKPDPIPARHRSKFAAATVLVFALAAGIASPVDEHDTFFPWLAFALICMVGSLAGMAIGRRTVLPQIPAEKGFLARIAVGGPAAIIGLLLALFAFAMVSGRAESILGHTWTALILPIAILNWVKWTDPHRVKRVSLGVAAAAAAFAMVLASWMSGSAPLAMAIMAGIALASGVFFPWEPRMYVPPTGDTGSAQKGVVPAGLLGQLRDAGAQVRHAVMEIGATAKRQPAQVYSPPVARIREVPDWVRWVWRGGMALLIALGPVLIAAAESKDHHGFQAMDLVIMRAVGVGVLVLGVFCFFQSFRRRVTSWWSYLIKPLILFGCLQTILISAFIVGESGPNDVQLAGIFFIIFPAIMFLTLLFVTAKQPRPSAARQPAFTPGGAPPPLPPTIHGAPSPSDVHPFATPSPTSISPSPAPAAPPRRKQNCRGGLCALASFLGFALHLATCLIAVAVALDLPGFISAGIVDPQLRDQLRNDFGENWQKQAHLLGWILTYVGAFLATAFLMLARRSKGIFHMIRPIFAAACFLIAMVMLDHSLNGVWKPIKNGEEVVVIQPNEAPAVVKIQNANRPDVGESITTYLEAGQAKLSIVSLVFGLAGLALLLWPPPHERVESNFDREGGVS